MLTAQLLKAAIAHGCCDADSTRHLTCAGEYGELLVSRGKLLEGEDALTVSEEEVVSVLESVLNRPSLTPQCRNYALTALMKLSVRFGSQSDRIKVPSSLCCLP